jgi:hypothetical protein
MYSRVSVFFIIANTSRSASLPSFPQADFEGTFSHVEGVYRLLTETL